MKSLVFLAVVFSLSAAAQESSKLECLGKFSRATIQIQKNCVSVNIEKKEMGPRTNCPRCITSKGWQQGYNSVHQFSTCNANLGNDHLSIAESTEADGKNITYNATSSEYLRVGHVAYALQLILLNKQDKNWELKELTTTTVNSENASWGKQYALPALFKFMSCKKTE